MQLMSSNLLLDVHLWSRTLYQSSDHPPHLLIELFCDALCPQQVELLTLGRAVDVSHLYQHLHDAHPLLLALPVNGAAVLDVLQESCGSHMISITVCMCVCVCVCVCACVCMCPTLKHLVPEVPHHAEMHLEVSGQNALDKEESKTFVLSLVQVFQELHLWLSGQHLPTGCGVVVLKDTAVVVQDGLG